MPGAMSGYLGGNAESVYKTAFRHDGAAPRLAVGGLRMSRWRLGLWIGLCSTAVLSMGIAAGPAIGADPGLTVNGSSTSSVAARSQSLLGQVRSATAGVTGGTGPTVYVNPSGGVTTTPGSGSLQQADQQFASASAAVFNLYRALGGTASDRSAVLQRKDGMFFVGVDGEGGRWFPTADQAMSFLFRSLVSKDDKAAPATKETVQGCADNIECAVGAMNKDPQQTIAT